jgi:hypothetical protein
MSILSWEAAVLRARHYKTTCETSPVYAGDVDCWTRALEDARVQLDQAERGLRRAVERNTWQVRHWDGQEETIILLSVTEDIAYIRYADGSEQSCAYAWLRRNTRR